VTTRIEFAQAVAEAGQWTYGLGIAQALTAMAVGEGSSARFNPIDTTLQLPGATPYNSFGPAGRWHVWNYPDLATGVDATTKTLQGWAGVDAALKANLSTAEIIFQVDQVAEGTPTTFYSQFVPEVEANWPIIGQVLIAGSGPDIPTQEAPSMVYVTARNVPAGEPTTWFVTADGWRFAATNAAG